MKKWSSQWTQFLQLRKEAWKKNSGLQRGLNPRSRDTGAMLYQPSYEATDVGSRSISYIINNHFFHGNIWTHSWPALLQRFRIQFWAVKKLWKDMKIMKNWRSWYKLLIISYRCTYLISWLIWSYHYHSTYKYPETVIMHFQKAMAPFVGIKLISIKWIT